MQPCGYCDGAHSAWGMAGLGGTSASVSMASADGMAMDVPADGVTVDAAADGVAVYALADGVAVDAAADGVAVDAAVDGVAVDAAADGVAVDAPTDGVDEAAAGLSEWRLRRVAFSMAGKTHTELWELWTR